MQPVFVIEAAADEQAYLKASVSAADSMINESNLKTL
jgi:hypothetical protein